MKKKNKKNRDCDKFFCDILFKKLKANLIFFTLENCYKNKIVIRSRDKSILMNECNEQFKNHSINSLQIVPKLRMSKVKKKILKIKSAL